MRCRPTFHSVKKKSILKIKIYLLFEKKGNFRRSFVLHVVHCSIGIWRASAAISNCFNNFFMIFCNEQTASAEYFKQSFAHRSETQSKYNTLFSAVAMAPIGTKLQNNYGVTWCAGHFADGSLALTPHMVRYLKRSSLLSKSIIIAFIIRMTSPLRFPNYVYSKFIIAFGMFQNGGIKIKTKNVQLIKMQFVVFLMHNKMYWSSVQGLSIQ